MSNVSRRRNMPSPIVKYCKVHKTVPVAPNSEYCASCQHYQTAAKDKAKASAKK